MIRLGLRVTLSGGRDAMLRVLVTTAAVALGVGLLLIALAGMNGLQAQTQRGAWLDTSAQSPSAGSAVPARLWWLFTTDQFGGQVGPRGRRRHGTSAPVPQDPAPSGTSPVLRLAGARAA